MTLNPIQFGTEVIDQFGRYLMTTFPIADREMEAQVRQHLKHDVGGERLIAKGPYVFLTRPFEKGPTPIRRSWCSSMGWGQRCTVTPAGGSGTGSSAPRPRCGNWSAAARSLGMRSGATSTTWPCA